MLGKLPNRWTRGWRGPITLLGLLLVAAGLAVGSGAQAERSALIVPIELTEEERAWRDAHPRIRAYFEPWPPFLIDRDGEEAGITVDYLELICGELGIEVEWVHMGWSEALEGVRRHDGVDVLPILTKTAARSEYLAFTRDYVSFPIVIFTRRESGFFIGGLDDLRDRTIAVERDYAMHHRLQKNVPAQRLDVVSTTDEALLALATGSADAYIGNLAVATYVVEKRGLSNLKVAAPSPFGTHDQAMGVRSDWQTLASLLDRGLESITPLGHNTIRQRWLALRYEHGLRRADLLIWVLGVVAVASIIVALILFWNHRLSREVTVRRKTEQALARSQAQLVDAQKLSKLGSWIHDVERGELTWSAETFRIFGRDTALGEPRFAELAELLHPEDWKTFEAMTRATRRAGERYEAELRLQPPGGGPAKTIICRGGASRSEHRRGGERAPLLVGTVQDVTESRAAEAERLRLRHHMTQAQKLESLGALAGGIAHDFNNILSTIVANTQMARDDLTTSIANEETAEYLDEVLSASRKAALLCHQMLAYSGQARFLMEPTSLTQLVDSMSQMLTTSVSPSMTLSFNLSADLPLIMGDGPQLRQVVVNLVNNAKEALGESGGSISITTKITACLAETLDDAHGASGLRPGDYVTLEVRDDGRGMNEETRRRLFEPFFSTSATGRGLGLSATLGIVKAHQGAIRFVSKPDEGSTFSVFFPALEGVATPAPRRSSMETPLPRASGLVLVVDDEPQVLETTTRVLAKLGFDTLEARSGREALSIFHQLEDPAQLLCVLLDLIMPEMDGKETFVALREIDPNVPVIMVSGYDHDELKRRFDAAQRPAAFVRKPYDVQDLALTLTKIAEERARTRARGPLDPVSQGAGRDGA